MLRCQDILYVTFFICDTRFSIRTLFFTTHGITDSPYDDVPMDSHLHNLWLWAHVKINHFYQLCHLSVQSLLTERLPGGVWTAQVGLSCQAEAIIRPRGYFDYDDSTATVCVVCVTLTRQWFFFSFFRLKRFLLIIKLQKTTCKLARGL